MRLIKPLFFVFFLLNTYAQMSANPFAINFSAKENITNDDYINIQNQLRKINIVPLLKELYPRDQNYSPFLDFHSRCTRGLKQNLINPEKGHYPIQRLEKIGKGSDMCIVCTVPYDGVRSELVTTIVPALEAKGFNGYFLYQMGGFPNPTGKEIRYVGVPYSFKIFMMLTAEKLGFNKVLWIDSAALPLKDPTPLFQWLDKNEVFIGSAHSPEFWRFIFPKTRKLLKDLTGTDVLSASYVSTMVFGLKMNSEKVKALIEQYYQFCELGTPFLSCFPEEFVFTALMGQPKFSSWKPHPFNHLIGDSKESYFHLRQH